MGGDFSSASPREISWGTSKLTHVFLKFILQQVYRAAAYLAIYWLILFRCFRGSSGGGERDRVKMYSLTFC